MQIAVKVLASLFAAAAGLALYAFGLVVYLAQQHQTPHQSPMLLEKLSISTTALGLFALLYFTLAWLLAKRVKWSLALILCGAALFGFPVGTVLGLAGFVVLTRPSVRASFAK
jgi:hypothetical protein